MAAEYGEPAKLTEKMREGITEGEPIDDMVKPEGIISPADVERDYEQTVSPPGEEDTYIKTASAEERNRALERVRKTKRKNAPGIVESTSLSKLHTELRKHSSARKKTDLAIKDIEKQLKSLLLAHHSAIRDLKKEVARLRKSIAAVGSRKIAKKMRTKKKGNKKPSKQTGS